MQELQLVRPDDWHQHLRDGDALSTTVPDSERVFARVVVMPNLVPPVCTTEQALSYRERIMAHSRAPYFQPMMALYLTDTTHINDVEQAALSNKIIGYKLYPAGATTHSDAGVQSIEKLFPIFEAMQKLDVPLLVHGEVTEADTDIFDREKLFIDRSLIPLTREFPDLRVVLEHITTEDAVEFVKGSSMNVAATITAHHLLFNRNHMLSGGIRPHYYCLPVLKRNTHQHALIKAATSGNPKFFLGTDSAPHTTHQKESACGCAGCYTAPAAIELYATAFEQADALDKLEAFASHFGADFYRLPRNTETITLSRTEWQIPTSLALGEHTITPLCAGETLSWKVVSPS